MTRPQVTREDVRRIITEYMRAHPPDGSESDELDEYAEKRGLDPKVWPDVIEAAANSGTIFFTMLMLKKGAEIPEDTMVEIDMEEVIAEICGAVAATFFMLGFEVAAETRGDGSTVVPDDR